MPYERVTIGRDVANDFAWRRILEEWTKLHRRFHSQSFGDYAYWYNEPANVSILAGAIWRAYADSVAICEHTVLRGVEDDVIRGRQDLWFNVPAFTCDAEFKILWPCRGDDLSQRADAAIVESLEQLRGKDRTSPRSDLVCAGVFVVPYMVASGEARDAHDVATGMFDDLHAGCDGRPKKVCASWMAARTDDFRGPERFMPGVALVARVLAR